MNWLLSKILSIYVGDRKCPTPTRLPRSRRARPSKSVRVNRPSSRRERVGKEGTQSPVSMIYNLLGDIIHWKQGPVSNVHSVQKPVSKIQSFLPQQRPLSTIHPALRRQANRVGQESEYLASPRHEQDPPPPPQRLRKTSGPVDFSPLPEVEESSALLASSTAVASDSLLLESNQSKSCPNSTSTQAVLLGECSPPPLPLRSVRQAPGPCLDTAPGESSELGPDQPPSNPSSSSTALSTQAEEASRRSSITSCTEDLQILNGDALDGVRVLHLALPGTYLLSPGFDWTISDKTASRAQRCFSRLGENKYTLLRGKVSMMFPISLTCL